MNRRVFFGWLTGLFAAGAAPEPSEQTTERPWSERANEDRDGVWADFAAWESWVSEKMPDYAEHNFDELDTVAKAYLYSACCDLADR